MTVALDGGEGSASSPGRSLPPEKTRYPLYRRLGGPQGRSGQVRKTSPPLGFDPRKVQPVASRYTDYATRPLLSCKVSFYCQLSHTTLYFVTHISICSCSHIFRCLLNTIFRELWSGYSSCSLNTLRTGDADLRFYVTIVQDGWGRFAFLTRWNSVHLQVFLSATPQGGMFPEVSHPQALLRSLLSISWKFQFTKLVSEFVINF